MFVIEDTIEIDAPIERCFLLSTSIDLVARTLEMRPVAGKTSGLIVAGDTVTWRGWKFGLPQFHRTIISRYERPGFFQDSMARGRFAFFEHDHTFAVSGGRTHLRDTVRFTLPFGSPGRLVAKYVLAPHIRGLVRRRFRLLKQTAETEAWRRYLPGLVPPPGGEVAGSPHMASQPQR